MSLDALLDPKGLSGANLGGLAASLNSSLSVPHQT